MQVFCKIIALNYTNSYNLSQNGGGKFWLFLQSESKITDKINMQRGDNETKSTITSYPFHHIHLITVLP